MVKWISRALAFVKVFAARLECPFGKSSAWLQSVSPSVPLPLCPSVHQPVPAASLAVCVSLKSIKMLQIKLKVSTFFVPTPSCSPTLTLRPSLGPRLGSELCLGFGLGFVLRFGFGFRFRWGLASASFACVTFSNDNYKSFLLHTFP